MECICRDQTHPSMPTRICPKTCLVAWATDDSEHED